MTAECFVDGGLREAGNKLAVRQIAAIALDGLRAFRTEDEAQRAALQHVAAGLEAVCRNIEPAKAMKCLSVGAAAAASAVIASAAARDEALGWLHVALHALVEGTPANEAFGWTGAKHRPMGNLALRNWLIQCEVHDAMRSDARPSWRAACAAIAARVQLSPKSVELIAKGITADQHPATPEDIFPVDPSAFRIGE